MSRALKAIPACCASIFLGLFLALAIWSLLLFIQIARIHLLKTSCEVVGQQLIPRSCDESRCISYENGACSSSRVFDCTDFSVWLRYRNTTELVAVATFPGNSSSVLARYAARSNVTCFVRDSVSPVELRVVDYTEEMRKQLATTVVLFAIAAQCVSLSRHRRRRHCCSARHDSLTVRVSLACRADVLHVSAPQVDDQEALLGPQAGAARRRRRRCAA